MVRHRDGHSRAFTLRRVTHLRGAIQHRCTFISHLKQLILIKSPRKINDRNSAQLRNSTSHSVHHAPYRRPSRRIWLIRVLVSEIGTLCCERSYSRPFTIKIRSFAIYGALNPPKCPNKPKNDTFKIICRKLKSNNSTKSDFCQSCLLNRATGCPGFAKFESCQIAL